VIGALAGMPLVLQALLATMFTWGVTAVILAKPILPYALAFAAGAMIFVLAEELIPEAKRGSPDVAANSLMVGFSVMMTLDVALG
jgi:ZIP family zinc transporter